MADYFTKLPRVPSPLEVMRKMGLNVPSEKGLANLFTVLPEVIGPQADIAGMVKDAKQIVPLIQSGSYGPALSSLGMATSAIPMMFLPGTVAGVKEGVKESVDSIKGAPLYEKLNPDKFKSGTPYAEKDWDKADGWRNYVDARKTAEKKLATEKLRAEANAQRFGTDYRMAHQPLSPKDGAARLDDLTGKSVGTEVWPDDVYSPQGFNYYGGGSGEHGAATRESYNAILTAKNNPNSEITIYRAVPNDSNITTINEGDFVSLSKKYAELHGASGYGLKGVDAGKVLSKKVKVKDIFSDGNDFNEFGYYPQSN